MSPQQFTANAWDRITENVKNVFGWSPIEQLYSLYVTSLLNRHLEGDIIEVGSWGGRSSIALGLSALESQGTTVHAIDYFPNKEDWKENSDGTYSFMIEIDGKRIPGHNLQTVWKEPFENSIAPFYRDHPNMIEYFRSNITNAGLKDRVRPFKGNAQYFALQVPYDFKCRMVYIDGEHSYESVKNDIETLSKFLVKDGIICFDDAFTSYDGVDKAITECVIQSGRFHSFAKLTRKLFIARKL